VKSLLGRFPIGVRLGLGFALILVLMAVIAAVALFSSTQARRQLNDTVDRVIAKSAAVASMRTSLFQQGLLARNIGMSTDPAAMQKDMQAIVAAQATYAANEEALVRLGLGPQEQPLLEEMQQHQKAAAPFFKQAAEFVAGFNARQAAMTLMTGVAPLQEKRLAALDRLVEEQNRQMRGSLDAFERASEQSNRIIVVIAFASIVFAAAIAWMLTRSITTPLRDAVGIAGRVAAGELDVEIERQPADETGQLLTALGQMNHALAHTVRSVRTGTASIDVASREIAAGNSDLSRRTEAQASSLQETASAMMEMSATVRQNSQHAIEASELASSASTLATQGGVVMEQVVRTMSAIKESSRNVFDIVGVIDGIAFQTNILALNASVEAARAGDQGRGFAVVAAEVRTLSQRSAQAATEIKQLVQDSASRVETGSALVDQAGTTMKNIVGSVQSVAGIMEQISAASRGQSEGIDQIRHAIAHIDEMAQQNAAAVEQAAASARAMQEQAAALTEAVSVFKLPVSEGEPA
jgi:methyl-accepting chemotaxis protein